MTTTKHTAEPWHTNGTALIDSTDRGLGETYQTLTKGADITAANAHRIVQCVNACVGKKDPQAYMDAVSAVLRAFDVADVEPHQRHALEALRALGG